MRHFENFGKWYDPILNAFPFCLDDRLIKTIGIAWIFKDEGKWCFMPRIVPSGWQYANAQFFVRLGFPLSLFLHFRLSSTRLFQLGFGWKQSGRFAIHCRLQTDASAAIGYHTIGNGFSVNMPNTDQSSGWDYGRH